MSPDPRAGAVSGTLVGGGATSPGPGRSRGPGRGWTLRRKLVASILALFVLTTLLTGAATTLLVERSLQTELDQRLLNSAQRAAKPGPPPSAPDGRRGVGGDYLLLEIDGRQIVENVVFTRTGAPSALTTQQVGALASASLGEVPTTIDFGGDLGRYRLMALRREDGLVVITGLPLAPLDASVARLRWLTLGVGLGGLLVLGLGTAWLVAASLRPLQRVASTATRVAHLPLSSGEVSLAERVPWEDTDTRTEVGQVGAALNDMLDHVDSSLSARQASETRLRQFVADASHELRTPLASIRGYAELSRREREPVPEGVRHALGRIESEADRMGALVEDLLLLARLDAGRPLETEPVDLTMLLVGAVSDAQVAGPDHAWRLDLGEEAVEVPGDRARLTQVVVNLLANARVHTPPGTTVTGRVTRRGDVAVLEVEDDGPGIDPALLPHIFGRFTRGDSARVRSGGSTGLGLSIVQAVAAAHHGRIVVESVPGRTVFRLTLPVG